MAPYYIWVSMAVSPLESGLLRVGSWPSPCLTPHAQHRSWHLEEALRMLVIEWSLPHLVNELAQKEDGEPSQHGSRTWPWPDHLGRQGQVQRQGLY